MKKLTFPLLILLILVITFSACAQSSHLDKFYEKYHKTDDGLGIDPTFLFSASFSGNGGNDDKDGSSNNNGNNSKDGKNGNTGTNGNNGDGNHADNGTGNHGGNGDGNHDGNGAGQDGKAGRDGNWMHKITGIRCMIIDGKKTPGAASEWSDLTASLRADHFEEWFSVRKGTGRVQLLSRDKRDTMEEIACLIVGDDGSGLFFDLRGHFTADDRARMESALQTHDSE